MTTIDRQVTIASRKRRGFVVKRSLFVFVAIAVLVVGAVAIVTTNRGVLQWPANTSTQTLLKVTLAYQHSDNPGILCLGCQLGSPGPPPTPPMPWHIGVPVLVDDVKYGGLVPQPGPGDNLYGFVGNFDDCPHCSVYSGPACIQMVWAYRFGGPPIPPQDIIYDMCELDKPVGELQGSGVIERHGYGVLDGTAGSPPEIQTAFMAFIGPVFQHNQWDASALTFQTLESYIVNGFPLIWDDHNGWPSNMDLRWPSPPDNQFQGHYKVIAGYDDGNTVGNSQDDFALIYDPWPGYNDALAQNPTPLPAGAVAGPTGQPDPYWLPVGSVLGDVGDLFLVEFAAIPEFSGLLIPIAGMAAIAIVAIRFGTGRREP